MPLVSKTVREMSSPQSRSLDSGSRIPSIDESPRMRRSRLLEKIRSGRVARICGLGHFIPAYISHAAEYGFDAIWLDMEHRSFTDREIQSLLAFFHQFDIDCMLRAPTTEKTRLYRYLEDGATGLMIPQVNTADEARRLVMATRFPPIGERGLDGASLDSRFYHDYDDDYTDEANRETFLVVQIETPDAVRNIEEIVAVEGITGVFVGPGDLGLRLRKLGESLTLEQCFERVAAACKAAGKPWGTPASDAEHLARLGNQGAQLLAHGGEFMALMKMLKENSADFDAIEK